MFLITFIVGAAGCRYRQEQVIFQNKGVTLAGTLTLPSGNGPHPAVVLIDRSGPYSRDNYRFYADVFARHGIATLIYDKRGVGASTGDWRRVQFKDLAEDALAGVGMLRMRTDIASRKIHLWGGSNGAGSHFSLHHVSSDVAFCYYRLRCGGFPD